MRTKPESNLIFITSKLLYLYPLFIDYIHLSHQIFRLLKQSRVTYFQKLSYQEETRLETSTTNPLIQEEIQDQVHPSLLERTPLTKLHPFITRPGFSGQAFFRSLSSRFRIFAGHFATSDISPPRVLHTAAFWEPLTEATATTIGGEA